MSKIPTEPLRKVTLNLFDADVRAFETVYGYGWSERLRQVVRDHVDGLKPKKNKTIGELYGLDEDLEPQAGSTGDSSSGDVETDRDTDGKEAGPNAPHSYRR